MVLGPQQWLGAQFVSQVTSWLCVFAAVLILIDRCGLKLWIMALVFSVFIARALRIGADSGFAESIYIALICALYCLAGAGLIVVRGDFLYKQVMWVLLLSVALMIPQVVGAGAWPYLLTTHGDQYFTAPMKTIFQNEDSVRYELIQGRPAGIFHSNIIGALIGIYGVSLHFTKRAGGRLGWTAIVCAMVVLTMSKLLFASFGVAVVIMILFGDPKQKYIGYQALVLLAGFLLFYRIVFPGLMAINLSEDTITTSLYLRLNDMMDVLGTGNSLRRFEVFLAGTARASWIGEGEYVSGYTLIIKSIGITSAAGFLLFTAAAQVLGLQKMKRLYASAHNRPPPILQIGLTLFLLLLYPVSFPIWTAPIYWFMMGLPLLPAITLLVPQLVQGNTAVESRQRLSTQ